MTTPAPSPEALDALIHATRREGREPATSLLECDAATMQVVHDMQTLVGQHKLRPGFAEELEARLIAGRPALKSLLGGGTTARPGHRPVLVARRRLLLASAAAVGAVALAGAVWRSPTAQAQAAYLASYIPGLGIRTSGPGGLVARQPVSVRQDGATMTVKNLLSNGTNTTVQVEVTGLLAPLAITADARPRLTLRDGQGHVYAPNGVTMQMTSSGRPAAFQTETTFPALDPSLRSVDVLLQGSASLGNWQVTVPLVPLPQADLPAAGTGSSGVTLHGITVTVANVVADRTQTVVQLTGQAAPPLRFVRSIGGMPGMRHLVLHDDHGRDYPEGQSRERTFPDDGGRYTSDAVFPPLPSDVHTAQLDIPFVTVSETAEATLQVPIAGKQVGERIPLDATLTLGLDAVQIPYAEIIDQRGERRFLLHLAAGDWHDGRKLVGPEQILVNSKGVAFQSGGAGDVYQTTQVSVVLPADAVGVVTITLKSPTVAIAGPWHLHVPLPAY
ncbi:MAG: hypothetical protein ACR2JY_05135 [Chloroflexota bacterium]